MKNFILSVLAVIIMITALPANAQTFLTSTAGVTTMAFATDTRAIAQSLTDPFNVGHIIVVDDRADRLDAFFRKYDMPLEGYGAEFVKAADDCGLDWRLIAAIGIRESSGGKHLMNNNPFGWGSAKIPFKNFSEAIVEVTNNVCGIDPDTARYYKTDSITKKLWYYNGSVLPSYTGEVLAIMDRF